MKPEEAVKAYLKERCKKDRYLAEAMKNSSKSIRGALDYAKKQAKDMAVGGCAVVESEQVFEWIVHYYLEDMAETGAEKVPAFSKPAGPAVPSEPAAPAVPEKKKSESEQMMLFDF